MNFMNLDIFQSPQIKDEKDESIQLSREARSHFFSRDYKRRYQEEIKQNEELRNASLESQDSIDYFNKKYYSEKGDKVYKIAGSFFKVRSQGGASQKDIDEVNKLYKRSFITMGLVMVQSYITVNFLYDGRFVTLKRNPRLYQWLPWIVYPSALIGSIGYMFVKNSEMIAKTDKVVLSLRRSLFSQLVTRKQGNRIFYQQLTQNIIHVPGENPNAAALRGTNCFVIGTNKERLMIDTGDFPPLNSLFLENLKLLLSENKCRLKTILITHAIPNHFGGANNVIDLHISLGLEPPKIFKKLDGNHYEQQVFERFPSLRDFVFNTLDGDTYQVADLNGSQTEVSIMETAGHRSDHLSFALTNKKLNQHFLFPGDMILGSPSVSIDDLDQYFEDLERAQSMNFEKAFLVHTLDLKPSSIMVDAQAKIKEYIKYRKARENLIIKTIETHEQISRNELFHIIYENEDLSDALRRKLAMTSFNSHLQRLQNRGIITKMSDTGLQVQ